MSTHYLAVFVSYSSSHNREYDICLLCIAPLENESRLGDDEHINIIEAVLDLYINSLNSACKLVWSTVRVKKSSSNKNCIPLVV